MTPTRQEIRANLLAWITDLETTAAKQGTGLLRSPSNEFCCLGRACEVAGWEWSPADGAFESLQPSSDDYEAVRRHDSLNLAAQEFFGITDEQETELMQMNDNQGKTFPEIAAWLRENVLPRFPEEASVVPSLPSPGTTNA